MVATEIVTTLGTFVVIALYVVLDVRNAYRRLTATGQGDRHE